MGERYGSGIRVPPPAIFAVIFLVALWIEGAFHRLRIADVDGLSRPLVIAGTALVTAGILLALWGVATFRRHHTAVLPFHRARSLVRSGPYRFTRNPMYLGFALALLGWAVWLGHAPGLLLVALCVVYLDRFQIRPEERMLAERFGEPYRAYIAKVRRWL